MKTLILMQGIPGSGKSTVAAAIQSDVTSGGAYPELVEVFSTDDFWYQWKGTSADTYDFDPALLGHAHEWNQARAKDAMSRGIETVIIDNTNIKLEHVMPYKRSAYRFGYDVQSVRVAVNPSLAIARQLERPEGRRVPEETICRMYNQMEDLV